MRRQAIETTPQELIKIAKELIEEANRNDFALNTKRSRKEILNQKWKLNIINKTKASDKWGFEQ
jgi:hypothetical protein